MEETSRHSDQEQDLIYALDIGTRSVIGLLARQEQDKMRVLEVERRPHERRTMLDGQIEDIRQVAKVVSEVTKSLEERSGRKLERACVAAAGRALRTERGEYCLELSAPEIVKGERISQLELEAVAAAERTLQDKEQEQRMFLVGYTVTQLRLDHYPMTSLEGHTGQVLEAAVVATFLPSEVVDSLYAVMVEAGLEVASLTLEPIAALNAAIPEDIRLLNLALVDIGAGTTDIALCRDGGVVGYTMATVAGDEITEALMRACLVDYHTAERIKMQLGKGAPISFEDVVGVEQSCSDEEIFSMIEPEVQRLADEIARRVLELNERPPSALFLAGGGSKLAGLSGRVADALQMDRKRVAVAGRYFQNSACSDIQDLDDPEYTTPLGIAVSAGLGLISDSYRVVPEREGDSAGASDDEWLYPQRPAGPERKEPDALPGWETDCFLWRTCPPGEACDQWSGGKALPDSPCGRCDPVRAGQGGKGSGTERGSAEPTAGSGRTGVPGKTAGAGHSSQHGRQPGNRAGI